MNRSRVVRFLGFLLVLAGLNSAFGKEVRIYTERHYGSDKTILDGFTEKTGIEVKVVKAGANELMSRIKSEAGAPQADLYITVDAATLDRASKEGIFEAHGKDELAARLHEGLGPESGLWLPLTMRARVIVYSKDRVDNAPATYADLADPRFKGSMLIRSSTSHYNQSLLASILAADGKEAARSWARGVKSNMARPPQGGDRDQVRAVALGLGDVAVSNSYYLGVLERSEDPKDRAAREAVTIVFPNQKDRGTHVNISGGGIVKGAPNREHAIALLDYLTSKEVQAQYQKLTSEFSVHKDVEPEPMQKAWGEFKADYTNLHRLSDYTEEAVKIFNEVGWQ